MNKFNVLIIGAGKIASGIDFPGSKNIFTHAHAFIKEDRFNLLGFVDIDTKVSKEAALKWGCKAFLSIEDAFSRNDIDVVCIAVTDDFHYKVLKKIIKFPVKFVFTEKPLTKTEQEAKEIIELYKVHNIPLMVNYTRRFIPEFSELRDQIRHGDLGEYLTGTGYYGKGILHNGSHLIDIIRFLIGDIAQVRAVSSEHDFYDDDPSVAGVLTFDNGHSFFLQKINCSFYTLFEIDILFEKSRIRITQHGFYLEKYKVQKDPDFDGYQTVINNCTIHTSFNNALFFAAQNIGNYLEGEGSLLCTAREALKDMEICLSLKSCYLNNEKNFTVRQRYWWG